MPDKVVQRVASTYGHTIHPQKPKTAARAAPKVRAAPRGRSERPPSQQANPSPTTDAAAFATRLDAAKAGLASLGVQWDPVHWAKESAALQAALARGTAAGTRGSGGKKGGARTPTKKDAGKALQAAVNDLEAAIKQWDAAAQALGQQTAQIAAGVYVAPPPKSPRAAAPEVAVPAEGRRATKLPPKFAGFETEVRERRAAKGEPGDDDGTGPRGSKRQRKVPTWLAHDHDME